MPVTQLPAVALFRSPPEFASFSMDQYAEHVRSALARVGERRIAVQEVRPPESRLSRRLRRGLGDRRAFAYWRRFPSYMRFARSTAFPLNHVLDHAYGHLAFALPPERTIVTCHDIFALKRWRGEIKGLPATRVPPLTLQASLAGLRRAGAIVTPTTATRDDIARLVGVDPKRVTVIPYGLNPVFRAYAPAQLEAARSALPGPADAVRLLAVDSGGAYKNHVATAAVLAALVRDGRNVVLVHSGHADAMLAAAQRAGVADAVVPLGPRTQAELVPVYNGCDLLLFPSYYEGFGWPPLEAMACGVPVAASTTTAVAEVVSGHALRADPDDHEAMVANVRAILDEPALRERLVRSGREHAATFTWELAGRRLLALYEQRLEAVA